MLPIQISYQFTDGARATAASELHELLASVRAQGSIGAAAKALGCSYRHLWGRLRTWEARLGRPLIDWDRGRAARLSRFGEKLLWAETRVRARLAPTLDNLAAEIERELSIAFDDSLPMVSCVASHDLALSALRADALDTKGLILDLHFAGSLQALQALRAGRCDFAGIHLPIEHPDLAQRGSALHLGFGPFLRRGREKMITVARRSQGLILAPDLIGKVARLADARELPLVTREQGSGTLILLQALIETQKLPPIHVAREERSHLAVAAAVAAGDVPVGFGIAAAAAQFKLGFVPVVDEHYFLVCHRDTLQAPAGQAVLAALSSASWQAQAGALPGYALGEAGEIVSLRRVLPWYRT